MVNRYHYQLGGLAILSEWELCQALPPSGDAALPDVSILSLPRPVTPSPHWQTFSNSLRGNSEQLFLEIPEVAQYLVSRGRLIEVYIHPGASWNAVELYLLGSAMGIIYHQRHIHPLHAACVTNNNTAVALAGDSGEGKTTLAYAMTRRGYGLLTDDVAPLTHERNTILVHREKPVFKIWEQTAAHFSVPTDNLAAISNRENKYYLPSDNSHGNACPLKALVVLVSDDSYQAPTLQRVPKLQALAYIRQHTYRSFLVPILWDENRFLAQSLKLLEGIEVWQLVRPRNLDYLETATDAIASL